MPFLQDVIHAMEVGTGTRYLRIGLAVLAILALTVFYDSRNFHNFSNPDAMDAAQVGRNLAEGKGFSTLFIRPLSMSLVRRQHLSAGRGPAIDASHIRDQHPDLANPPMYPLLLAGLMKVLPFHYTTSNTKPFWSLNGSFARYQPDFLICLFNQLVFLGLVVAVFFLARRLFDAGVAWLSAFLVLGSDLLWRFSLSGLSTMVLLLIFLGLVWCLVSLEQLARDPQPRQKVLLGLAVLAGGAVGLGALTRYAFGWLILPVLLFILLFAGARRVGLVVTALCAFVLVLGPWLGRNYSICGAPFGTAGYAVLEDTYVFPENRLERSVEPQLNRLPPALFWQKLLINGRQIVQNELPKLGGSWVTGFFLAGLMVGFRNPALRRLRYFLLSCLVVLALAQALGRTQLSVLSPEINSDNLLVLLAPLVLVYGVSLFFLLLDQISLPFPEFRYVVVALFGAAACLPVVFSFLPPRSFPIALPYFPPVIQKVAGWTKPDELAMSDIPWAVAWYGHRQCIWLTLRPLPDPKDQSNHEDFLAISDYQKPICMLLVSPLTMHSPLLSQWSPDDLTWANFLLQCVTRSEVPTAFPLRKAPPGGVTADQLMLFDWERWVRRSPPP